MLERAALNAIAVLVVLALSFTAGWFVKGWKEDSARLEAQRAESKALEELVGEFNKSASATVNELMVAREQQGKNRREIVRELTKVEYRDRECFSADVVGLLNSAAKASSDAGPDSKVPAGAAGP